MRGDPSEPSHTGPELNPALVFERQIYCCFRVVALLEGNVAWRDWSPVYHVTEGLRPGEPERTYRHEGQAKRQMFGWLSRQGSGREGLLQGKRGHPCVKNHVTLESTLAKHTQIISVPSALTWFSCCCCMFQNQKLAENLSTVSEKLDESKELLKNNENGASRFKCAHRN